MAGCAAALFSWFGIELMLATKRRPGGEHGGSRDEEQPTQLKDKIREVLTEARVVLPGAQALLGFQFIAILMESFDRQPKWLHPYTHLASLGPSPLPWPRSC